MLPSKLIINEHEITNDKAIADQLNKGFSNIGKNLALTVPKPNLPFNCYLDKPQASSFFLIIYYSNRDSKYNYVPKFNQGFWPI